MADNWVRMRAGLLTNPKVIRMARILAEDRKFISWWTRGTNAKCDVTIFEFCDVTVVTRVTVGSLLSLWASVNESASRDNFVKGITLFEVDAMAGVPGFGDALVTVGWAEVRHDGIVFPNFEEHNTTEKARSGKDSGPKTPAQRTREWRERKASQNVTENVTRDVTCDASQRDESDVTVTPREEKRREEEIHTSHVSRFNPKTALEALGVGGQIAKDWMAIRKARKAPLTETALASIEREAAKAGISVNDALSICCERNWQGFKAEWMNGGSQFNGRANGHSDNPFE